VLDMMDLHPIRAYKKVTMTLNGVTKNVVVPVPSHGSHENDVDTEDDECVLMDVEPSAPVELPESSPISPNSDYNSHQSPVDTFQAEDDECVLIDNEPSGPVALPESSPLLPKQSDTHSTDLDVEIISCDSGPDCDTVDLTLSPVKMIVSRGISHSHPAQNAETNVQTTGVACTESRRPTGIAIPITFSSSVSTSTVLSVTQPVPFPSATIFRNVTNCCHVDNARYDLLSSETSADPVVIEPPPGTEVSTVSVISSPRTMTKQEAIAAGWFTDEGKQDCLQSSNPSTNTLPIRAPYNASVLSGTLPLFNNFSLEPTVENNFMSSAEFVSLETVNDVNGSSTNSSTIEISNHTEKVPVLSNTEDIPYSCRSGNPVTSQHEIEIDIADDRKPQLVASETKMYHKLEKLDYDTDEDGYNYVRLMSEEDEPLTVVVEGVDDDNSVHGASAKAKPVKKAAKETAAVRHSCKSPPKLKLPSSSQESTKTAAVKRGRGRPPKLKLPSSSSETVKKTGKAKRSGGRPLTAAERYGLKDCGVWLHQLSLPIATVNIRAVWRYLCCRQVIPPATGPCTLCHAGRKSDSLIELEVARKFRSGTQHCEVAMKKWREFFIDPHLLPKSETTAASESKKSPAKKSPAKKSPEKKSPSQVSDSCSSAPSSQENKKYLLIRSETGIFVVPVESAVGCIVSEQEVATMLCSQTASPSSLCAGKFSNDTLLAACSRPEQSSSQGTASPTNKPSSSEAQKTPASAAGGNVRRRLLSKHSNSLRFTQRKAQTRLRSVANSSAGSHFFKRKRLSAGLVQKAAVRPMERELRALGVNAIKPYRTHRRARCKTVH